MIDKNLFVKAIHALESEKNKLQHTAVYAGLICVLESVMDCPSTPQGKTWLRWWMEDNDFGKKQATVRLNNHEEEIETPEELYDFLVFEKMKVK